MPRSRPSLLALCALALAAPSFAQDHQVLQPTSDWQLDYAEDSCALRRSFGTEGNTTWLELRSYSLGDDLEITVSSDQFAVGRTSPTSYFVPHGQPFAYNLQHYRPLQGLSGVQFYNRILPDNPNWEVIADRDLELVLDPRSGEELASFRQAITGFVVEDAFNEDFILATGGMFRPMGALRLCINDLLASWGIDPDHPSGASRQRQVLDETRWQARLVTRRPRNFDVRQSLRHTTFRLLIDETGAVASCRVTRPVVDQDYSDWACRTIAEDARFVPALDEAGEPAKSLYWTAVLFTDFDLRPR